MLGRQRSWPIGRPIVDADLARSAWRTTTCFAQSPPARRTRAASTCRAPHGAGARTLRGQLGDNGSRDSAVPVAVSGGGNTSALAWAGTSLALWTRRTRELLGRQRLWPTGGRGRRRSSAPVAVAGDIPFTSIAAGNAHACGVTAVGDAYCWGRTTADSSATDDVRPSKSGPREGDRSFRLDNSGSRSHLRPNDGEAYCWGHNTYGQLGDADDSDQTNRCA